MTALAVVCLVLAGLCLLPVGVWVRFDRGDLQVAVKAGPVTVPVYPPKPDDYRKLAHAARRAQKPQKPKKEKKKPKKEPKTGEKPKKKWTLSMLLPLIRLALGLLGQLRRKLLVRELTLRLYFGGADAAEQAIGYGRAWAAIGAATPVLENTFRIRKRELEACLDWQAESLECFLQLEIRIRVGAALWLALKGGAQFLRLYLRSQKTKQESGVT